MTHLGYIITAYLASAVVLAGMTGWVLLDLRQQKRKLRRLDPDRARDRRKAS